MMPSSTPHVASSSSSPMDVKDTHGKAPPALLPTTMTTVTASTTTQSEAFVPSHARLLDILQLSTTRNPFLPASLASLPPFAPKSKAAAPPAPQEQPSDKQKAETSGSTSTCSSVLTTKNAEVNATLAAPFTKAVSNPTPNGTSYPGYGGDGDKIKQKQAPAMLIPPKLSPLTTAPTLPMSMLPPDVAALSVQDIAKEAMRITKESMRKQQQLQQHAASAMVDSDTSPSPSKTSKTFMTTTTEEQSPLSSTAPTMIASSSPILSSAGGLRLNKFVRRLHDMIQAEQQKGIVEWRRGLLVLHSTAAFAKTILPQFFNTRNFKTFRRQLNYYGFVHVRSFSNTAASTTTALWVHQDLAATLNGLAKRKEERGLSKLTPMEDPDDLCHILKLRRVEPNDDHKTVEGRRQRKEMALFTVEEDLQVSTKSLQRRQIEALLHVDSNNGGNPTTSNNVNKAKDQPKASPPPVEAALPPPAPLVPPCLVTDQNPKVPLFISVPNPPPIPEAAPSKRALTTSSAGGEPPKKKNKRGSLVSQRSMSDTSCSSVAVVSEPDDEAQQSQPQQQPNLPPRSTSSAANLLLLLSQGGVQKKD